MSEDVVPVEEYDELSKLVDKLLTEKAQLQLAVEKQADQLKVSMLFLFFFLFFFFAYVGVGSVHHSRIITFFLIFFKTSIPTVT